MLDNLKKYKNDDTIEFSIAWSVAGLATKHVVNMVMLYLVFFKKGITSTQRKNGEKEMSYKILIILRIAFSVGLTSFLMYHYF